MLSCDFCGGPRLNGTPVTRTESGGWRVGRYPEHKETRYACRSCATQHTDA